MSSFFGAVAGCLSLLSRAIVANVFFSPLFYKTGGSGRLMREEGKLLRWRTRRSAVLRRDLKKKPMKTGFLLDRL
ncbi:uncharacterized protein P884DRAFT_265253 [Thermothelomyces heterothallicus CBS 202.75]|uniref:uncharacterized protein n=1 Tax=Thermothelomyces heterothallicus CBS 202.75 TaxID=1149848 RepID=UPI0037436EA6